MLKIIRDLIRLDLHIVAQLVDQAIHLRRLVVDGPNILPLHLRTAGDPIEQALAVALDRRQRRLQIMGNVGDQLTVGCIVSYLLLLGFLETNPHLIEGLHQLTELVVRLCFQREIEISGLDALRRRLQLIDRTHDPHIDPADQKKTCKNQNRHIRSHRDVSAEHQKHQHQWQHRADEEADAHTPHQSYMLHKHSLLFQSSSTIQDYIIISICYEFVK